MLRAPALVLSFLLITASAACRGENEAAPDAYVRESLPTLLDHTRSVAKQMRDRRFYVELLAELADAFLAQGTEEGDQLAPGLLDEATAALATLTGEDRELATVRVVAARARSGKLDDALALASSLRSSEEKSRAEAKVAVIAAGVGQHRRAAEIAERIALDDGKGEALVAAVKGAARSGDFETANNYAKRCPAGDRRSEAYAAIARALINKGNAAGAQKAADQITSVHFKSEAAAAIALYYFETGQTKRADKLSRAVESSWIQARLYADMAQKAQKAGTPKLADQLFEKAIDTALGIHDDTMKAAAIEDVADRALAIARLKEALALAEKAPSQESRGRVYAKIVADLLVAKRVDEAEKVAKQIAADPIAAADANGALAVVKARGGDLEGALELIVGIASLQLRLAPAAKVIAMAAVEKRPATSVTLVHLATLLEAEKEAR